MLKIVQNTPSPEQEILPGSVFCLLSCRCPAPLPLVPGYATPVNNLLFLPRLELLHNKAGCVPHFFSKKESMHVFLFSSKTRA